MNLSVNAIPSLQVPSYPWCTHICRSFVVHICSGCILYSSNTVNTVKYARVYDRWKATRWDEIVCDMARRDEIKQDEMK